MKVKDAFVLRNIYGKHILMPVRSNEASNDPILLNDVAVSIWSEAEKGLKKERILKNIAQSYQLQFESPELLAVEQFMEQMERMGLIESSGEEDS